MKESYCIVDKRVTPCTEPSGYQTDKRGITIVITDGSLQVRKTI